MKRLLNFALVVSFQFCYLEWPNHSMFVFQAEQEIFSKPEHLSSNFSHPIILLGLLAQITLILAVFLPSINNKINSLAVLLLTALVLLFTIVGVLSLNLKIIGATLPFLILALTYFLKFYKK